MRFYQVLNKTLNLNFIACLFFGIIFIFIVSGFSILGIVTNLFGLLLALEFLRTGKHSILLLFVLSNLLLGPFMLINTKEFNLFNIGRFDYIYALILSVYIISQNNSYIKLIKPILFLYVIFMISTFSNYSSPTNILDLLFSCLGRMCSAFIIVYLIVNNRKIYKDMYFQMSILLIAAHFLVAFSQLFYSFSLRSDHYEAKIKLFGYLLNRPVGLLASSYVFGVVSSLAVFILLCCNSKVKVSFNNFNRKRLNVLLSSIFLGGLSTRSNLLALFSYLSIRYIKVYGVIPKLIFTTVFLGFIILNFRSIAFALDQSNATKFLLWYQTLTEFLTGSWKQILLGFGYGESLKIANTLSIFLYESSLNISYDNNIDKSSGFPIHNVFLQVFYEFGIIVGSYYIFLYFKALHYVHVKRLYALLSLGILIFVNYSLHNGMFSHFIFLFIMLTRAHSIKLVE